MLKAMQISQGRLVECLPEQGQVLMLVSPDEGERRRLIEQFKIDEHNLVSALDPDELARLEFEPDHLALIFKLPKNYSSEDNYVFRVISAGLFLFPDRLVIVSDRDLSLLEGRPFQRIASLRDLTLKILLRSVFHFVGHLRTVNAVSGELEEQINTSMENKCLFSLFTLEKSLVYYLNAINSNAKVIERLKVNAGKVGFSPEDLELLDDLIIENTQCYEQAEIYSNILSSMMDARVSIVSNNLNVLIKKLTLITIGLMVPTLVVSAFSMNVEFPLKYHPLAFWMIAGLAAAAVVGLTMVVRMKRW